MKITEHEKSQLKDKIANSISTYVRRKRFVKYGIALAATVILGFFAITKFQTNTDQFPPIETYVKTMDAQKVHDQVKLILGEDQNLEIADSDSNILYSNNGEKVSIGNSKSVNQTTSKNQRTVFNTLIVPYGKRSTITLADGTKVWLNSGSRLVFPAVFNQDMREVYLEGEGIFEVTHDKAHPFIVKTDAQDIEVLGTVFNVSNYHDDDVVSTVLKSGSVKISNNNSKVDNSDNSITIVPNTLAVYDRNDNRIKTQTVEVEKYFSWRDGIFIFKNDSMKSIMKKVSRYYNMEIVISNGVLSESTFSGYLDVKDNVENVIKIIQETTKFEYTITNNKLIIN
ncbi:MAG: FecR family protein [Aquaticitalea sp.]